MIAPTLQECYQRGVRPEATAMLPALFFVFMEQWHKELCRISTGTASGCAGGA